MSGTPRLSVVMPMRNSGHCVCQMLDSLATQRIPMQIVVVDDASEDDSVARVAAWSRQSGQPVELVRNARQLYSYGSRLRGLARATAPVVWCVDADDRIPPNADVAAALAIMEQERPDILHCKACGVLPENSLQKPLTWTEPIAEYLYGKDIFAAFLAHVYPPAILWNKFFSARLAKAVLAAAPDVKISYFDVKFLGLLFLLYAESYTSCNELIYEYRMRTHRPAWLYARQVDALLLLEQTLEQIVKERAPEQLEAFRAYCHRRLVIQSGHLSLMAEAELRTLITKQADPHDWLEQNVLANISRERLLHALHRSLTANNARLCGWAEDIGRLYGMSNLLPHDSNWPALDSLLVTAEEWLGGDAKSKTCRRIAQCGMYLGRSLADSDFYHPVSISNNSDELLLALLLANAQLARAITAVMAPGIDITKKAN